MFLALVCAMVLVVGLFISGGCLNTLAVLFCDSIEKLMKELSKCSSCSVISDTMVPDFGVIRIIDWHIYEVQAVALASTRSSLTLLILSSRP